MKMVKWVKSAFGLEMVKWVKSAFGLFTFIMSFAAFGIDADIAWEDMPPTNKVKDVVEQFAPAPGNYAAVSNAAMNAVQPSTATNIAESTAASATNGLVTALASGSIEVGSADFAAEAGALLGADYRDADSIIQQLDAAIETNAMQQASFTNYATRAEIEAGWWSDWTYSDIEGNITIDGELRVVYPPYHQSEGDYWAMTVETEGGYIGGDGGDYDESATELRFRLDEFGYIGSLTATRHRVAAPVPTKPEDIGAASSNDLSAVAFTGDYNDLDNTPTIPTTASDVGAYSAENGATLAAQVSAIGAHLNAEDAHFVSTNYDSVVHVPEAYVEIKMSNEWLVVWREKTRWDRFTGELDWDNWETFQTWKTNVESEISFKADRAWGAYDSETGGYSPDGYTQISSSNILIAAGMAYQRTITSGGAVWVLQCNQGTAHVGGDTNGFFRIVDGDGNTQFEIIKGDRQELGCDADGISVGSGSPPMVTIPYSIEATEHPTLMICDNLATVNWKAETDNDCIANVSWSGTSGEYVATVQRKAAGNGQMFVKASYMAGAETYIKNNAPVGMDSIILNGTKYYLGTATISGHTVLTLSTTAP